MTTIKNKFVSASFNEAGGLTSLKCLSTGRELLNKTAACASPFTVWTDTIIPNDTDFRESYKEELPIEPSDLCKTALTPDSFTLSSCEQTEDELRLTYTRENLQAVFAVRLVECELNLSLSITNISDKAEEIFAVFPALTDINMEEKKGARMLIMNQAGYTGPCWVHRGGFYGNTRVHSAQFGCMYDKETCLGFYIKDDRFTCKDISYQKPSFEIRWAPGKTLAAGETIAFPDVAILVYGGSWMRTARAYGDWFRAATNPKPLPEWVRKTMSYSGGWTLKKGTENDEPKGAEYIDTMDELPNLYLSSAHEVREFAFYCDISRRLFPYAESPTGERHIHTDGWNEIRSDMGGAEAMARGIKGVHKMKRFVTLYIEGLITPPASDLYVHIPEAKDWVFINPEGINVGPYTNEGWYCMCPGSGWADHLAQMAARLVRETDCDGIRLDCLGCHFKPCWNETHNHKSPYDYNEWMLELFEKVGNAVRAVKPDVLLSTEYPVDYFSINFNHALFQAQDDLGWHSLLTATPMNVALPHYRIDSWGGGPVAQAMQLVPMAGTADPAWLETRHAVADMFLDSEIMPDPTLSRADALCRRMRSEAGELLFLARPDFPKRELSFVLSDWAQPHMSLKKIRANTKVSLPLEYEPAEVYEIDIQSGVITPIPFAYDGAALTLNTMSIFAAIVIRRENGPAFLQCRAKVKDGKLELNVTSPMLKSKVPAKVYIDGMEDIGEFKVKVPGRIRIPLPEDAHGGVYRVHIEGNAIMSSVKLVAVNQEKTTSAWGS